MQRDEPRISTSKFYEEVLRYKSRLGYYHKQYICKVGGRSIGYIKSRESIYRELRPLTGGVRIQCYYLGSCDPLSFRHDLIFVSRRPQKCFMT